MNSLIQEFQTKPTETEQRRMRVAGQRAGAVTLGKPAPSRPRTARHETEPELKPAPIQGIVQTASEETEEDEEMHPPTPPPFSPPYKEPELSKVHEE